MVQAELYETDTPATAAESKATFQKLYELSEEEAEAIKTDFIGRLQESTDYMEANFHDSMLKNYKKYKSVADPILDKRGNEIKDRANIFIPYPWGIVETEIPRLAGRLPRIRAFPRRKALRAKVDVIQDNIYYTFDRMDFVRKQIDWVRQHSIYGWSPLFYFWREEERQVLVKVPTDVEGVYQIVKKRKKVWDDFDCRVLDVWDVFFQPGVCAPEDGDYLFFREFVSHKDLKRLVAAGEIYGTVLEELKSPFTGSTADGVTVQRDTLAKIKRGQGKYGYGAHEMMYMLEDDRVVIMIDRKVLARVSDNPHPLQKKSIITMSLTKLPSEAVGMSTVESLAGEVAKLNGLSNARLDNIAQLIRRVFVAKKLSPQTDMNNLVARAGNIIYVDDINETIRELQLSDIGTSSAHEIMVTKEEMQFVTGISDFVVGVRGSARLADTATGVSTIVREANARFALKLAAIESGPLRSLVEAAHAYQMTFMPDERMIWVHGPKGYRIRNVKIEEILCECDFTLEPGSSIPLDQLTRRESLTNLLDRSMRSPQIVNQRAMWREVMEAHDLRNADELLLDPEPVGAAEDAELIEGEHVALLQGQPIELAGDDLRHLQEHQQLMNSEEFSSSAEDIKASIMDHIGQHVSRLEEQRMRMQQQLQMQAQAMNGGLNAGNGPAGPAPGPAVPDPAQAGLQA